jgi:hypothetical protein
MSKIIDLSCYFVNGRLYDADLNEMHIVKVLYRGAKFEIVRIGGDYHELHIFNVADIPIYADTEFIDFSEKLLIFLTNINLKLWLPILKNLRRFGIL